MKNFAFGILVGIILSAMGGYLAYPKLTAQVRDEAFESGKTEGAKSAGAKAMEEGIAQGMAQAKAEAQKAQDSLSAALAKAKATPKVIHKVVEEKPKIQNWRVLGGQLAEPIVEENTTVAEPQVAH